MSYQQDVSGCLSSRIGKAGLDEKELAASLESAEAALRKIRDWHKTGSLPLLRLPARRDDLGPARKAAAFLLQSSRDIVFFGTGGSSLGGQALAQLAGWRVPGITPFGQGAAEKRFHFFDNLDGSTLTRALSDLDLRTTSFFVVSKSGGTPETVTQALAAFTALEKAGLVPARHMAVLTEPGTPDKNVLRKFVARYGLMALDHDPAIGGRYSVLSNVGAVPAIAMGLNPVKLREGAHAVMDEILDGRPAAKVAPALGAAVIDALSRHGPLNTLVLMPYSDRLRLFSSWFQQLWAESLGKDGKGTQPIAAAGPVDQHSQMQLFLAGPNDKLTTVIHVASQGRESRLPKSLASDPQLAYLAGRSAGELTGCQSRATVETFARNGRPVRAMSVAKLDERTMGSLLMHFMLETIIMGHLMGVDPFDQPAVEQGKILTREYLSAL